MKMKWRSGKWRWKSTVRSGNEKTNDSFTLLEQYGIRAICDFMADNERKFDPEFYAQLEQLELAVNNKHPYKLLARFYHFVCQK